MSKKVTNKRLGELVQAVFVILGKYPDGRKSRLVLDEIASTISLTEYEQGFYGKTPRFETMIRFATVDCVRAEWLIKQKGVWILTDEGRNALKKYPDPAEFHRVASRLYNAWRKENKATSEEELGINADTVEQGATQLENDSAETITAEATVSFETADEQAWEAIEEYVQSMPPYEVQEMVADLLRAMNYHIGSVAAPGKDAGVDIIAHCDPLGTQGPRIKVQVKRQQAKVTLPELKSFMANIGAHDSGIFMCTGGFTRDAEQYAIGQESKRIMLIDLVQFVDLWKEFTPKLSDRAKQRLPLTPIYFLTPRE